ncbi:hypothetical protein [Kordia sp.]|uniref:hypothetical protein n=1 Tax=Kordia sp. TaxID=1965332 RepID=UPI003D2BC2A9
MKFKKTVFRLHVLKSKIAKVSHQNHLKGGLLPSRNCEASYPKSLPNNKHNQCHSAIQTVC